MRPYGCLSDLDVFQMDVFNTFIELLRQTGNVTKGQTDMNETRQVSFRKCPHTALTFGSLSVAVVILDSVGAFDLDTFFGMSLLKSIIIYMN